MTSTGMKGLLTWCKQITRPYENAPVTNMTTSWRNGLAFCAIIHYYRPDLIDYKTLSADNILENNALAFHVAEEELEIPALLDAEDMLAMQVPDKLSIMTYLSQYYNYFRDKTPGETTRSSSSRKRPNAGMNNVPLVEKRKVGDTPKPAANACHSCGKTVFLMERLSIEGCLFHRVCFKCHTCAAILKSTTYEIGKDKKFYCEKHGPSSERFRSISDSPSPLREIPENSPVSNKENKCINTESTSETANQKNQGATKTTSKSSIVASSPFKRNEQFKRRSIRPQSTPVKIDWEKSTSPIKSKHEHVRNKQEATGFLADLLKKDARSNSEASNPAYQQQLKLSKYMDKLDAVSTSAPALTSPTKDKSDESVKELNDDSTIGSSDSDRYLSTNRADEEPLKDVENKNADSESDLTRSNSLSKIKLKTPVVYTEGDVPSCDSHLPVFKGEVESNIEKKGKRKFVLRKKKKKEKHDENITQVDGEQHHLDYENIDSFTNQPKTLADVTKEEFDYYEPNKASSSEPSNKDSSSEPSNKDSSSELSNKDSSSEPSNKDSSSEPSNKDSSSEPSNKDSSSEPSNKDSSSEPSNKDSSSEPSNKELAFDETANYDNVNLVKIIPQESIKINNTTNDNYIEVKDIIVKNKNETNNKTHIIEDKKENNEKIDNTLKIRDDKNLTLSSVEISLNPFDDSDDDEVNEEASRRNPFLSSSYELEDNNEVNTQNESKSTLVITTPKHEPSNPFLSESDDDTVDPSNPFFGDSSSDNEEQKPTPRQPVPKLRSSKKRAAPSVPKSRPTTPNAVQKIVLATPSPASGLGSSGKKRPAPLRPTSSPALSSDKSNAIYTNLRENSRLPEETVGDNDGETTNPVENDKPSSVIATVADSISGKKTDPDLTEDKPIMNTTVDHTSSETTTNESNSEDVKTEQIKNTPALERANVMKKKTKSDDEKPTNKHIVTVQTMSRNEVRSSGRRKAPERPSEPPATLDDAMVFEQSALRDCQPKREDIAAKMKQLEERQGILETKGVEMEKKLRQDTGEPEENYLSEWFHLVNEKNQLLRRENELVYMSQEMELLRKQRRAEFQLRQLMMKPEEERKNHDKATEEDLLEMIIELVQKRSAIVDRMDEERIREYEEDAEINMMMESQGLNNSPAKEPLTSKKSDGKSKKKKEEKIKKDNKKKEKKKSKKLK